LGRADDQVKIRGFRVELGEIEAALAAQPGVAAAAAVVRTVAEVEQVVGFVVVAAEHAWQPAALRRAMSDRLPPYMVPAHCEIVSQLPRLGSGKVDRHALRRLPLSCRGEDGGSQHPAPRDQDEQALAAALARLFPGQVWRPDADFFADWGGHSLLAARLISLLRADPRYAALSVQEVYRQPRLEALAQRMGTQRRRQPPTGPPLRPPCPACGGWCAERRKRR